MRKPLGPQVATAGTVLFLSSPLNQNYMSAVLIDPMAVCFSLWAFHFGASLLHESRRPGALWVGFTGCCLIGGSIKPLYLFPVGVMGLVWLVEHRRLNPRSVFFGAALLIAVSAILAWNHFAMLANAASPFTQGLRPTSLLGFSRLAEFSFLRRVARLLLIETLGPAGGLLALTGWGWLVLRWRCLDAERKRMLTVTGCAVFGYWFLFANIIFPHDYYSLIAVPFCAVAAATGAGFLAEAMGRRWPACGSATTRTTGIAALAALVAIAQYLRAGGVPSSPHAIEFERLTSGRFEPGAFAIVFIGAHRSPGGLPIHEAPSMLYAARLRGTGLVVADASQAVERWKALRPHYRHLRYVVFYGLDVPE
jgi:hypothetical protein